MKLDNYSGFISGSTKDDVEQLEQFGTTSLAYKIKLNGQVCFMKRLRPELRNDQRVRELFYKEYNTGKKIDCPHVVKYLDIKDDADGLCIIMEYVNGRTLKEKIEKEPQYFNQSGNIKRLLLQLCKALEALHGGKEDATLCAMQALRTTTDALERKVADKRWPLPKYRDMLFLY